ncbi:MAG TPA: hypothetical protein VHA78_03525 [Candidatus Peribacteraceae bacterium]|nr:hypothetical protein [Candidatus Peribacteraceae bacterium]
MFPSTFSLAPVTQFFLDNPGLRAAQTGLVVLGIIVLFLLFFALRDILLRTRSFWYQFICIVIVTLFPVVGFLVYLLIRPARTIKQRELESMILTLVANDAPDQIEVGENEEAAEETEESEETDGTEEAEEKEEDHQKNHHKHSHDHHE